MAIKASNFIIKGQELEKPPVLPNPEPLKVLRDRIKTSNFIIKGQELEKPPVLTKPEPLKVLRDRITAKQKVIKEKIETKQPKHHDIQDGELIRKINNKSSYLKDILEV